MVSSKEKNKSIPRKESTKVNNIVISELVDIPLPVKNECSEQIKNDISKLEPGGKCLQCSISKDKTPIEWQRYISSICSNYSRKLGDTVKFTIRVIDKKYIGVWRTK